MKSLILIALIILTTGSAQDISCPPGQLSVSVEFGDTQCAEIPICVEGFPTGNCPADAFCGIVRTGVHGCRRKDILPSPVEPTTEAPTTAPTDAPTTVAPTNATTTVPTNATTTVVPTNATTTVVPTNVTTTVVPTNSTNTTTAVATTSGLPSSSPTVTSGGARLRKLFGLF